MIEAEAILKKEPGNMLSQVPTAAFQPAMDAWLDQHKAQIKGQINTLKKHVAKVTAYLNASSTAKQEYVEAAAKYGLSAKLAVRMPVENLTTCIAVC